LSAKKATKGVETPDTYRKDVQASAGVTNNGKLNVVVGNTLQHKNDYRNVVGKE